MNVATLIEQLDPLEERYQDWVGPINQAMREWSYKVNYGALKERRERRRSSAIER